MSDLFLSVNLGAELLGAATEEPLLNFEVIIWIEPKLLK